MENLERKQLLDRIVRLTGKAIKEYGLIEENDRVLVGVSGGKDSLALLEILGRRMKIFNPRFTLVAAHIGMENIPYRSDTGYLEEQAARWNIPFVHYHTSFDPESDPNRSPCFLCSWNRRKALFRLAGEHGCNKIALGHHQDDILQTLLMNMTFQGAFSTMPPKLVMNKFAMTVIRPFCLVREKDLLAFSRLSGYVGQKKKCPYEQSSSRPEMKEILRRLEDMNPQAVHSLWGSMNNVQPAYLPAGKESPAKKR